MDKQLLEQEESLENGEEPDTIWAEHVEQLPQVWNLEQTHPFHSLAPCSRETKVVQTSQPVALAAESTQLKEGEFGLHTVSRCTSKAQCELPLPPTGPKFHKMCGLCGCMHPTCTQFAPGLCT